MSNKDYTKYAKGTNLVVDDLVDVVTEPEVIPEPVVEPVIEAQSITPEPIVEDQPEIIRNIGYVSGCARLNVRSAAKFNADVVCEIPCGTEVEIDEEESSGDYYKVCTSSGIEGFCMKTYITIE